MINIMLIKDVKKEDFMQEIDSLGLSEIKDEVYLLMMRSYEKGKLDGYNEGYTDGWNELLKSYNEY